MQQLIYMDNADTHIIKAIHEKDKACMFLSIWKSPQYIFDMFKLTRV